jgi:hypothetical protein
MTEFCHKNIYYLFSTDKCRHKYNINDDNFVVENYFINDEIFVGNKVLMMAKVRRKR